MDYTKHEFKSGDTLYANDLNEMDEQIYKNTENIEQLQSVTVPDWAKQPEKPAYTANEVGADAKGTAATNVSEHNTSETSHNDIRQMIQNITVPTKTSQLTDDVGYAKQNDLNNISDKTNTKSQIQMGELDTLNHVPVLKIHQMTREEYEAKLASGGIEDDALYITPEEKYVTHEWNGTVLSITSASGTTSADLKGAKGDKGDKGDSGNDASVTSANITSALGYTPANPNTVPSKTETWTFTLEDGTEVTKMVYVG